ncbi:hypothetical protein V6Z11_A04G180400 [Gossypium hirsutum]
MLCLDRVIPSTVGSKPYVALKSINTFFMFMQQHDLPATLLPQRGRNQRVPLRGPIDQDLHPHPLGPSQPEPHHDSQPHLPLHVWVPPPIHHEDRRPQLRSRPSPFQGPTPEEVMLQPHLHDQHPSSSSVRPQHEINEGDQHQRWHPQQHRPHSGVFLPSVRQTDPLTLSTATSCIIFWLIVILAGLLVLMVYLIFRPHRPLFDLNGFTLNAATLDTGYLLDADVTLLVNFTNPNKKVSIDFNRLSLDLYFDETLIATQYIEPFSAAKGQTMFASIHMIASQVSLSMKEALLFENQIKNNQVLFSVKGAFRARSKLGGFMKYSYWLHSYCGIIVSSPPTGVLREKNCRTKH